MKKSKTPLQLRIIKGLVPIMERIFPWIMKKAYTWIFYKPRRHPFKRKEQEVINQAKKWKMMLDDKQIQLYRWGSGSKRALFVHGWSGKGAQGGEIAMQFIESGYSFYTFDFPGHGLSTGRETNFFEVHNIISGIVELIGTFDCIIGHSFGGIVATYCAQQNMPFRKLVLIGSPVSSQFILDSFARLLGATNLFHRAIRENVFTRWGVNFDALNVRNLMPDIDVENVLVIHDRNDREVPFSQAELLREGNRSPKFIVTKGLGHKRILSNSEVINRILAFSELGKSEVELNLN